MNIARRCHLKSLNESFELVLIASTIALVADTGWVLHDILSNGLSIQYMLIGGGLLTATGLTILATVKHHWSVYKRITKELLDTKLKCQRRKNKNKRK